jgi:Tfp pilus assembly protein PilF
MEIAVDNPVDKLKSDASTSALSEPTLIGTVLAITAVVYVATVRFDFVYDDQNQIVRNTLVQSWAAVPGYFTGHQWLTLFPNASANYYRPLNFLWFRVNDALFGTQPFGWHAMAILLHLFATFLAYTIARRVTGRPIVAALTALLFGVHPTRHEVVAWVSGTTESLWAVFFLLAFLAYLQSRDRDRVRWIAVSCACYAAGLLAKETAIVLPIIIFAHAWLYGVRSVPGESNETHSGSFGSALGLAAIYGMVAVAYLGLRISVLHHFEHPQTNVSLRTLILTLPSVAFFYVRQWLLPMHVGEFYDLPLLSNFDVTHVLAPLLALLVLGMLLWFGRKWLGAREVTFGLVWLIAPLLPVLDFAVLAPGQPVHDRYFYVPSFGAALLSALLLAKLASGAKVFGVPRRLLIPTLGILLLSCYATADASSYWIDDYALFQHAYELTPNNVVARVNYAIALARRTDYIAAMKILDGVLYEEPNNWLANYNLGRVFYDMGLYRAAEGRFAVVENVYPDMPDTYLQLGLIDIKTDRAAEAETNLRHAVQLQPSEAAFRFSLGVALEVEKKCDDARAEFASTLAIDPNFPKAQEQMTKCGSAASQSAAPATAATDSPASAGSSAAPGVASDAPNAP